jgi:magnesium-transporting ATPase (P-type)
LVVPLLATQILWINLVTDSGPALAMGVDPEIDDVMARKPRRPDDRIVNAGMWGRIVATGLLMGVVTLVAIDVVLPGGLVPGGLVPGSGSLEAARTAGFSTLVLAQLFNALNARSARSSAFRGLFGNGWLWASLGLGVVLQVLVVHLPPLQVAFGTVPLTLEQWAMAVGLASIVLWVDEVTKLVLRRWFPRP